MRMIFRRIKQLKELWDWLGLAWQLASAFGLAGLIVTFGSVIWALLLSLPGPFILMGGFCTGVGTIYLVMAPLIYRALKQQQGSASPTPRTIPPINYKPIRLQHQYPLGEVSRLWVGLPPSARYANHESNDWYNTLVSAIQQGRLKFQFKTPTDRDRVSYERQNPDPNTKLARDDLQRFAASIGEDPPFLHDN